jgi:exosortase/archaeosortase family protein
LKFLGIFCALYFGTLLVIGISNPGNYYVPFVADHLDYVSFLKRSLINGTVFFLSLFHISTQTSPGFLVRITGGRAVIIAMSCVGYGVYSFWIAFVAANRGSLAKKLAWISLGLLALWLINDIRITLFLLAINKGWPMPLGIDHHTWFAIFAYLLIFILIALYDRSLKKGGGNEVPNRQKITEFK